MLWKPEQSHVLTQEILYSKVRNPTNSEEKTEEIGGVLNEHVQEETPMNTSGVNANSTIRIKLFIGKKTRKMPGSQRD